MAPPTARSVLVRAGHGFAHTAQCPVWAYNHLRTAYLLCTSVHMYMHMLGINLYAHGHSAPCMVYKALSHQPLPTINHIALAYCVSWRTLRVPCLLSNVILTETRLGELMLFACYRE